MIKAIGFDGDDTLWHSESLYLETERQLCGLLREYGEEAELRRRLLAVERRNLHSFGYGVKSYTLSMIECALEVSERRIGADVVAQILGLGKQLLASKSQVFDGVHATLSSLRERYALYLITKGDLAHQQRKVRESQLADVFHGVEIVAEKDVETYAELLRKLRLRPDEFLMVGNSMRSDIEPVLELGASAVLVPHQYSWSHEEEHSLGDRAKHHVIASLNELQTVLASLAGCAS